MLLEELKPGLRIDGLIPAEAVTVIAAQWHGADALELTYKTAAGRPRPAGRRSARTRTSSSVAAGRQPRRSTRPPSTSSSSPRRSGSRWRACSIRCWRWRPATCSRCRTRSARSTASCCRARRCGSCSPTTRAPARRSWPGSTSRSCCCARTSSSCLIVAPGGLVEQWQDELFFKFGLRFDLLTNQLIDANVEPQRLRDQPAADRPDGPALPQRGPAGPARRDRVGPDHRRRGAPHGRALLRRQAGEDQALPARRAARRRSPATCC